METVKATIKRIVFQNEESGFKVIKAGIPSGPLITLTGEFGPEVISGMIADFHGDFKSHPKYGTNFRVVSYDISHNIQELESIKLFLDAVFPNIGPKRAAMIVDFFKDKTVEILDDESYRLLEIEGIGKVLAEGLKEAWDKNRDKWSKERQEYTLRAFLYSLGLKERRVKKILRYFGGPQNAEKVIKENPYKLTEIEGFGFSTADFIAKQLGVLESDPLRLQAFIYYCINVLCTQRGHLYLGVEDCIELANKYSAESNTYFIGKRTIISNDAALGLKNLIEEKLIKVDKRCLYSLKNYNSESKSASKTAAILNKESDLIFLTRKYVDEHIDKFEHENRLELSEKQREALYYFVEKKVYVITGGPGTGKCLGYDTPVLMYSGEIKAVQNIKRGDLLMGDDSLPREVLSTCQGREEMYRVTPKKGDSYTVNKSHILSIKESGGVGFNKGNVRDIALTDYLQLSRKKREHYKGYRVPVDFTSKKIKLDPYLLGFWLGNGAKDSTRLSTPFLEVIDHVGKIVEKWGLSVKKVKGDNVDYDVTCDRNSKYYNSLPDKRDPNIFLNALKDMGLLFNKHIPMNYKVNNRHIRLQMLAGLIDADGHLDKSGTYDVVFKLKTLADGTAYIAKSLGFSAYVKPCRKTWNCVRKGKKYQGEGNYYRMHISGKGMEEIPCVVPKKKAKKRIQIKDVLVTGIDIESIGEGDYYGFEIDGNGRFLLGDFTVTHNTTVLKAIVSLVKRLKLDLTCMTPTGISAKKMASTVDYEAYTIHRRLGFRGNEWRYGETEKYETDVTIIDEACLPYKQFINLADGSKKYIGTIVNQKLPVEVLSYNINTGLIEPKKIINWFKYPYKNPLYRIKLSKAKNRERQRIFRCTGNHKIYTENGLKKASEITTKDKILVKGTFLNPFQKSFLLGAVLGDAHLCARSSGKTISFVHCQEQKEYLFLKSQIFNCSEPYQCVGGYLPEKKLWKCSSKIIDDLDEIYTYTYPSGKRGVTIEWLSQIDEIGLAVWYMDNGSLTSQNGKSFTSILHTEAFSKRENEIIRDWLKERWGLNSSVYKNRDYYLIRLTCESSLNFWEKILPWVIPSMAYKFPEGYKPYFKNCVQKFKDISPYTVQEIQRYEPKGNNRKFIYDIEVKDNHNYLSNDVVVSNSMVDQEVYFRLLSALKDRVHLIFVGDKDQLPSVGAGNVLKELITCGEIPVVILDKIFRQDEASDIIKAAHKIKNGDTDLSLFKEDPKSDVFFIRETNTEIIEDYVKKIAQKFKDERRFFQILTPRNDGPLSVNMLNDSLQDILNPKPEGMEDKNFECQLGKFVVRRGDRVIIIKNDYELGVFNGEVGKVTRIDSSKITIQFEEFKIIDINRETALERLKLAYALSVHRCIPSNTIITMSNGMVKMSNINIKDKVHISKKESREVVWHGDTGIKKIKTIRTKRGYKVGGSNDHKFKIADNKNVSFKKMSDIRIGDYACINRDTIRGKRIKLFETNIRGTGITPRKNIKLPKYLNKDISWLLGALVGDGSYRDRKDGTVEFSDPENIELLDEFKEIITSINLNPRPHFKEKKPNSMYVCSKNFRDWLFSIGYDYVTSKDKDIPDLIFETTIKNKLSFISGLIDTDGSVNKRGLIRYVTVSSKVAYKLQLLLLSCGIISSVNGKESKVKTEKYKYTVVINMNGSFQFKEYLRCRKKYNRIKKDKKFRTYDRNIPFGKEILHIFFSLFSPKKTRGIKNKGLCSKRYYPFYRRFNAIKNGRYNLTYDHLDAMIKILNDHDIKVPENFMVIMSEFFFYDEIISIEDSIIEVPTQDMEIKDKHEYIANGFICHNSQGQEYPYIILPFINQFGRNMLQRNLLYTAITRAKTKVIVIGHGSALEKAIDNASVQRRNTKLGERITECLQKKKKSSLPTLPGEPVDYPPAQNKEVQPSSTENMSKLQDIIDSF